ncbi:ABC transporter substrate-binding protein [Oceanospirillum linum]|uniref:ABC transporter permease n=1 Tax=Oceanospirillum linum TaxID=966 RepID=A0A1T1HCB4_OCELI|nr:ABC transporter substrate-binding protein [Oceanospirillum linum]OOV87514.1 ABC transporter permease [Oceanospirillum linum]SEF90405.1 amino acid/amide ABC transporter substrate-binding protein, HAAT family [Oleiphilus messinensis]SMP13406.1 amino acid/amide ABC transporter substrate-binding protein, HAAT family [Oceanospirillum linum]
MKMLKKLMCSAIVSAMAASTAAHADISDNEVRIGYLADMSGTYSALAGPGGLEAAKMAIEDFGGKVNGKKITIVSADDQNKPDIGANKVRQWIDVNNVDMVAGMVSSAVTIAVNKVVEAKDKVSLVSGSASSSITNQFCTPNSVHYVYDTYALAHGTGEAVVKEGGDSWFFLTADYAFGHAMEADVTEVVKESGGKIVGGVRHPLATNDFSSFILQAQASGAKIVGLANAGADTTNSLKTAKEFGVVQAGQKIAGLLIFLNDVHSLGLETTQGLQLTTGYYWDRTAETRAWSKRYFDRTGKMPTMVQAGIYSSVTHYLDAIKAKNSDKASDVMAQMRETPINDFFAQNGRIREDGRMVHDMYLAEVKKPSESTGEWDLYKILRTIPADKAFRPLSESKCKLVAGR